MNKNLFLQLKKEMEKDHGLTKNSIDFVPFEKWRKKLGTYPDEFNEEYKKILIF